MKHLIILVLAFILTASAVDDARKANEAYEDGKYAQAVELYEQAIEQNPENAKLHFNLASALYKMGRTEEAMQAFDRFENLTETPDQQALGSYNQGTMLTEQEKYQEAVDYFREALKKNPDDPDARHNYELAMQYQKQKQEQQQQQDDQGENNEQENEQQQQQQQQNNDNQEQNQDQPPNSGQQQDQQENEEQQPMPKPTEMTQEEAKNILDALEQLERELLENMKKEPTETQSQNEKDW